MSREDWNDGRNTEDVYQLGLEHGRADALAEPRVAAALRLTDAVQAFLDAEKPAGMGVIDEATWMHQSVWDFVDRLRSVLSEPT